jgi:hypothetical protein
MQFPQQQLTAAGFSCSQGTTFLQLHFMQTWRFPCKQMLHCTALRLMAYKICTYSATAICSAAVAQMLLAPLLLALCAPSSTPPTTATAAAFAATAAAAASPADILSWWYKLLLLLLMLAA